MDLSIIIVNWNSADYLGKCLASLFGQIKEISIEVIVVDNASYDGSEILVKNEFPQVIFIQSTENMGFARANNLGYRSSRGRNLLFLNPDTLITDLAINTLYKCLISIADAGTMGCRLVDSNLRLDTSCVQPFPTILNQSLDFEYIINRFPQSRLWKSNPLIPDWNNPREVEVIIGACIMIKRHVFEEIGLFSTDYFMYAEDIDLCFKVKKAGYKNYYTGEVSIIHYGAACTKTNQKSDFKILMMRESILRFIYKFKGKVYGDLYRCSMAFMSISRLLLLTVPMIFNKIFSNSQELSFAFYKWKKILRWSVGLERWTKEYYKIK